MGLSNAERQQRYVRKLKSRTADADFADLIRGRYRAGALSVLDSSLTDADAALAASARAVAGEIGDHLNGAADLLNAVEQAGATWARARWQQSYQAHWSRRSAPRRGRG